MPVKDFPQSLQSKLCQVLIWGTVISKAKHMKAKLGMKRGCRGGRGSIKGYLSSFLAAFFLVDFGRYLDILFCAKGAHI